VSSFKRLAISVPVLLPASAQHFNSLPLGSITKALRLSTIQKPQAFNLGVLFENQGMPA
jgi:hypothetical protein